MANLIGKKERFTKDWLSNRKGALEKMQKHLKEEVDREAGLLQALGTSHRQEMGERSEEGHEGDEAAGTLEVLQSRLARVEEALENIRLGTYGTCPSCHCPIPLRRLEVLPSAIRCSMCQKKREASRPPHPLRSISATLGTLKCQIKLPTGESKGN